VADVEEELDEIEELELLVGVEDDVVEIVELEEVTLEVVVGADPPPEPPQPDSMKTKVDNIAISANLCLLVISFFFSQYMHQ
jgi:hypothetical protein